MNPCINSIAIKVRWKASYAVPKWECSTAFLAKLLSFASKRIERRREQEGVCKISRKPGNTDATF